MQTPEEFFATHPEAAKCFVALGIAKATAEEAEALLGGVKGAAVQTVDRQDGIVYEKESDVALSIVITAEEEENAAQSHFEKVKTEEAMQDWVKKKAAKVKAEAAYNKQLKKEAKEAADKKIDAEAEVTAPAAEVVKEEAPAAEVVIEKEADDTAAAPVAE